MNHELAGRIKHRFDHEQSRRVLREKYQARMMFAWAGGMFRAEPEMISFLSIWGDQDIVVQDIYQTPIKVNARELGDIMRSRLQEQMNAWLIEYQLLSRER